MQATKNEAPVIKPADIFQGGGEMGALMRAYNWEQHPLGPPEGWPESLKNNIRLILHSGFPMFIWWSRELYMFHNDAYLPALGDKHPKALGASARQMWAEIWDDIGKVVTAILAGGQPFYAEALPLELQRKGFPEETYWTFSYSAVFDDQGAVAGIFCACQEVTATILGERRLKSLKEVSEQTMQIQSVEQAAALTCNLLTQNQKDLPFCLIYLLDPGAASASLLCQVGHLHPAAAPAFISFSDHQAPWPLATVLASGQMALVDCRGILVEAAPEPGSQQPSPVKRTAVLPIMRPGQHQLLGYFIAGISPRLEYNADYHGYHALLAGQIATSITSVQAREELARQQQYLRDIFLQAPVGIAILSGPEHRIALANPGICHIWGRRFEEVIGKTVVEGLPEVSSQGFIELLDQVYQTGEPYLAQDQAVDLDRNGERETVYLNFLYHPMRDTQGLINGVIAVAIDISEQVRYRRSVEALNEELLTTNADLDNFVYAASHDLKGPILNIEGLMEALLEYLPPETLASPAVRKVTDLIQGAVDRFKRTVSDLTDITKIQRQAGDDVGFISLSEVVSEVLLDFEGAIAAAGARVETSLAPEAVIRFSAKNLRSIIYNLVSNALKYRDPDRLPHIRIFTETGPDQVQLSVADNGLGLNLADQDKIFSMFKRLHDHVEGSGIGLYIVKRIVENAGGSIALSSTLGQGSTFRISFVR
ncbi:MAG: sensor histidine kinase [Adhaeribacter sp.]